MLNKTESKVMKVLCEEGKEKVSYLISPTDLKRLSGIENIEDGALDKLMGDLCSDGYFELVYSDRHGEEIYCVALTSKGKGYLRGERNKKRNLLFRLLVSVVLAVVSFAVGLILKVLFN